MKRKPYTVQEKEELYKSSAIEKIELLFQNFVVV